jgi:enoyl-CoA hydratase/carnithine racemase
MAEVKSVSSRAAEASDFSRTAGFRRMGAVLDALRVDRRSLGYCRVTFNHPPINTITATTVAELGELVGLIEEDPDLRVVVFDSANPDFYLAHYDVEHDPAGRGARSRPTGMHAWSTSRASVARAGGQHRLDRGRARGAGASSCWPATCGSPPRENTLLGQFEVGIGRDPGGGRWPGSRAWSGAGARSRSCSSPTISTAPRAEQYGYVNRLIAEARARREVEAIASTARALRRRRDRAHEVLRRSGDPAAGQRVAAALDDFFELLRAPRQQAQSARLQELGLNTDSDLERSLGKRVVESLAEG